MKKSMESKIKNKRIVGRLVFNSNYRYSANKRGISRYQFIPINGCFPQFLVASNMTTRKDHYAVIEYVNWTEEQPVGQLVRMLGPVGDFEAEVLTRAYHRDLFAQKMPKKIQRPKITDFDPLKYFDNLPHTDRTYLKVYSIDPPGCRDIDDAFTCEREEAGYKLSVHIADVGYYIDYIKDLDNLRPSSIYLPNKVFNMLPEFIATDWASLLPEKNRLAWTISYKTDQSGNIDQSVQPTVERTIIRSSRAWTYDQAQKSKDPMIDILRKITDCRDTHKIIERLMVFTNNHMAEYLTRHYPDQVIYRTHNTSQGPKGPILPIELENIMCRLVSHSAIYDRENSGHANLGLDSYIHFTSPLRRKVDLYHHLLLSNREQKCPNLDQINTFNTNNRRFDRDLDYLQFCFFSDSKKIKTEIYLIDRPERETSNYQSTGKATIYLPSKDLVLDFRPISETLEDLIESSNCDQYLTIHNKVTGQTLKYPKYQPIEVDIYFYPDNPRFYDKIRVQLSGVSDLISE